MDKSSWGGVLLALGGILAGLWLEGGRLGQIIQPTAAMIVFGGTFGAVMLQFPLRIVLASIKRLGQVFFNSQGDPQQLVKEIVGFAHKARKEGIVSLDRELENVQEPFLRKSLMLAVDGTEPQELRKIMELELDNQAEPHLPFLLTAQERIPWPESPTSRPARHPHSAYDSLLPLSCAQPSKITPPAAHQTGRSDAHLNRRGHTRSAYHKSSKPPADSLPRLALLGRSSASSRSCNT